MRYTAAIGHPKWVTVMCNNCLNSLAQHTGLGRTIVDKRVCDDRPAAGMEESRCSFATCTVALVAPPAD